MGRIEEETKNGKGRCIELSERALESLRGHRNQQADRVKVHVPVYNWHTDEFE